MPQSMKREVGNTYSAPAVKFLFEELYRSAHIHPVRPSFPAANEGANGDIVVVDDATNVYVCVKTTRGWFRTTTLVAL